MEKEETCLNDIPPALSDIQVTNLKKFRENVSDILKPDQDNYFLVKWLRARNFDLKKSEDMMRKSMSWRQHWNADNILTDWQCPEVIERYHVGGICGYDKNMSPVWIYKCANLDMKGIAMSAKRDDIIRKYIWKMETNAKQVKDLSKKLGKRVDQAVLIADLEGYTMKHLLQPGMDVILKVMALIEANYPENLKKAYVVNAPAIFPLIFKICKPFMSEDTKRKVTILGSNWKEDLLAVIDADQLPEAWGGTKLDPVDGSPTCGSLVCLGGVVPSSYYLKGSDLVDQSKVTRMIVRNGHTETLQTVIDMDNVSIRYTFWTDSHDLKFGISFKELECSREEVLRKLCKVSCHMVPEDGIIQCSKRGTYLFHFDNSYSWFHSKPVHYVIEVLDPQVMANDTDVTCTESAQAHHLHNHTQNSNISCSSKSHDRHVSGRDKGEDRYVSGQSNGEDRPVSGRNKGKDKHVSERSKSDDGHVSGRSKSDD